MDLALFLNPVNEKLLEIESSVSSFVRNIKVYSGGSLPNITDYSIALIGLQETRGGESDDLELKDAPDTIREKLYQLKKGTGRYDIIDLGNLVSGVDLDDTNKKIQAVCEYLISNSVLPILMGGTHDLDYGQYLSYETLNKLVTFLNVDSYLDMEETGNKNKRHLHDIMMHMPNYLFHYSHLAYQSYVTESRVVDVLHKLYFETHRLGVLRDGFKDIEPVIRDADLLSFDLAAIRNSDSPANPNALPFGLTGEEACQICWYAGHSDKLSSAGFYEYYPALDDAKKSSAMIISTMIWYFIEGYYHRKDEKDFRTNDYLKYVVSMPSDPGNITFFKSKFTEKWWLEVPLSGKKSVYQRNYIVPCNYSDYELASKGEVPDRYINALAKRP